MKRLRDALFWAHLAAGVLAGLPIAVMSLTGIVLAFEPQLLAWAEREARAGAAGALKDAVAAAESSVGKPASTVTLRRGEAVEVGFGGEKAVFVSADGAVRPASGLRKTLHAVEDLHRWLAYRPWGKPVTGFCTLLFCLITLSGLLLWWPRGAAAPILALDARLRGKAADFNRHNAVGLWAMPVLFVLSLSGVVIAYPSATALVYRAAGEAPPKGGGAPRGDEKAPRPATPELDAAAAAASAKAPGWTALTLRLPAKEGAPLAVSLLTPDASPRQARSTLTLDAKTGAELKWEPASSMSRGRRWRTWLRFLHTGEALGWLGQLVAALACAGALVLAWTGLALSWRRFAPKGPP